VFCVGNYGEILLENLDNLENRSENELNNGTGMLYAIPFGNLDRDAFVDPTGSSTLAKIRNEGSLRCGVVVPLSFGGNIAGSNEVTGMGVDFCHALAAAIFIGDLHAVKFSSFPENETSSVIALANGTIDVLVGEGVHQKYDFETSPSLRGLHFSTPYYYGNESNGHDASIYSLATLEGDAMFASFVNSVVLATIFAQENGIQSDESGRMPFVSIFGNELKWALKDSISAMGNYAQIYKSNFGNGYEAYQGRNTLNTGGPLLHSLPMNQEPLDIGGTHHLRPNNDTG